MKVFVAGGTGVIGRPSVRLLVESGHEVSALVRSEQKAELVRSLGATPVRGSLFDAGALRDAVAGHDAVVNLATHIPPLSRAARASAWDENSRIRTEGARNLVDAALAAGASRYVQESVAFLYAGGGDRWLDEDSPFDEPTVEAVGRPVVAAEGEAARFTRAGGDGVVLRFGFFHSPDAVHTAAQLRLTRWGVAPMPGPPDAYVPSVHAADAARAVVAALGAPAGAYNVVDDEPLTRAGYADACTAALGDPGLLRTRPRLAAPVARVAPQYMLSQRVTNRRFREAAGWVPAYPSARETMVDLVQALREPHRVRSGLVALLLVLLGLMSLPVGAWALGSPSSFYETFPGFGRVWISPDGPFNEHLLRDFGGLLLGLALSSFVAAASMLVPLVRAVTVAHLVYGVPHVLYHATHLGPFDAGDRVAIMVSLAAQVVLAAAALALSFRTAPMRRIPQGVR